ncbi:putative DNA-binding transcriptional regulator YafY [Hymenobacter luteus]|uniref:DNA-binding transcriptional regulator YafY n=2 Tax=Hymenobacter TaxID=89966 RepID=A0ABR6JZ00_9BACT|nr:MULTISPECIES: transcriptional regulator [Hymenobacter]MBB4601946.1 putative DNA-binding transcriptional regulator YafY [Hymenobacter latericoloratus]MBB6059625.1 putative DNA-binding transcriptional regulator YafY [Hymenobacter luteus]
MIEQAKLLRVFTLIRLLKQGRHTLNQLARLQDCHPRTIRRYLKLLEEVGYHIDEETQGRGYVYLFETDPEKPAFFSAEETYVLRQAVAGLEENNPLRESLSRKLYQTSELVPLADELLDMHQARVVQQLAEALRQRCRVRLVRYQSPHSGTVRDREVEPLGFTDNYAQLNAVDVATGQTRTYKTRRIEDVTLLDIACSHAATQEQLDVFGLSGPAVELVELHLTARAYRLLVEEHPGARAFVLPTVVNDAPDLRYVFRGEVRSYLGIGRFVLGLPTEVRVVQPATFREFLREKAGQARW